MNRDDQDHQYKYNFIIHFDLIKIVVINSVPITKIKIGVNGENVDSGVHVLLVLVIVGVIPTLPNGV